MTWKSRIEYIKVPKSMHVLLIEKLLSAAIYKTYSIRRICTVGVENSRSKHL
jgi:hypothetical protein